MNNAYSLNCKKEEMFVIDKSLLYDSSINKITYFDEISTKIIDPCKMRTKCYRTRTMRSWQHDNP